MSSSSKASLFALLFVIISNIVSLIFLYIAESFDIGFFWVSVVSSIFAYVTPFSIFMFVTKGSKKETLFIKPLGLANILIIALLSFFAQPFLMLISAISSFVFPNSASAALETFSRHPFWFTALCVAVLPAIFEELVFRGFVFGNFQKLSFWKAAVMSGLLFAMAHMDGQQFLYAFIMGIFFCVMVHKTGSIFSSMLSHFTMNFSQSTFAYIAYNQIDIAVSNSSETTMEIILPILYMNLLMLPILFILIRLFFKINKKAVKTDIKTTISFSECFGERAVTVPFICFVIIYIVYILSSSMI